MSRHLLYYYDEAARYREQAAATPDSGGLRESFLALARCYEQLAETVAKRERLTNRARSEDPQIRPTDTPTRRPDR